MSTGPPTVTTVVVAYGAEPSLEPGVHALLGSAGVDVDVVLVDNGCTDGAVDRLAHVAGVTVVRPPSNGGFAGGCNEGAAVATGEVLAFVNPDAVVEPDALRVLAEGAQRPSVGIATASVRLADRPDLLNSAGNDIHFTGMSWSGRFEEPAKAHPDEEDVAAASGAAMAIRRSLWEELGGFDEEFFSYYEDADLSLRCWLLGLRVIYLPGAVVTHRYEFSRNPDKFFLLERNRAVMVWSCWPTRLLLVTAPALLLLELATVAMSLAQGWHRQKWRAWRWLWHHRSAVHARRLRVQASRRVDARALAPRFATRLDPGNLPPPAWTRPFDRALEIGWSIGRRLL